jgi:hypothetical protein
MRVEADSGKGELGHIRTADQNGAGGAKTRYDRGVALRRRAVVEGFRSGQCALARDVEEVL